MTHQIPSQDEIRERFKKWRAKSGLSFGKVSVLLYKKYKLSIHRVSLWQFENGAHGLRYDTSVTIVKMLDKEDPISSAPTELKLLDSSLFS